MPEQDRKIYRLLRLWENSPILVTVKKAFFQICGLSAEIMTYESLKLYIYEFLDMYMIDKLVTQLWRVFSPKGEPVNLFRFA